MDNERKKSVGRESLIPAVYEVLLRKYGPQGWWPVTRPGSIVPEYSGGPESEGQRFEVAAGAILTQNTAWANASRSIENLNREGMMNPEDIASTGLERLAAIIRPSGYFNLKAERLKLLASCFLENEEITRESLLKLKGVGPETADSIMLYAFGAEYFVVDAYTRRIFSRTGVIGGNEPYEWIRSVFERNFPVDSRAYNDYHALIVEHARRYCLKRVPACGQCPVKKMCSGTVS